MNQIPLNAKIVSFSGCRLCGLPLGDQALQLGRLPVCNRFTPAEAAPKLYDLALDQCGHCSLVQLRRLPPVDAIVPKLSWISYREPDGHLDAAVANLIDRHLPTARSAFGVGAFEGPLLDRLAARGLQTEVLDARPVDAPPSSYLETWQRGLNRPRLQDLARIHGQADIVSCRYLIEHCHDPVAGLAGLSELLRPDGLLWVELPDSSKFLNSKDYCFLWEEHVSYFVERTLRRLAIQAGFEIVELMRFEGQLEDAFVVLLRPAATPLASVAPDPSEALVYDRYRAGFDQARASVRATIDGLAAASPDSVALFGLGHQAIMFVNAMGIAGAVAAAVDDDANKRGQFAPGFKVPVTTSADLVRDLRIRTCLLAVNPGVEHKIKAKLAPMVERGVQFHSIFAGVPGSILSELPPWR